jgi:hypothetical protein
MPKKSCRLGAAALRHDWGPSRGWGLHACCSWCRLCLQSTPCSVDCSLVSRACVEISSVLIREAFPDNAAGSLIACWDEPSLRCWQRLMRPGCRVPRVNKDLHWCHSCGEHGMVSLPLECACAETNWQVQIACCGCGDCCITRQPIWTEHWLNRAVCSLPLLWRTRCGRTFPLQSV